MLCIACFFLLLAGLLYYQKYRQHRKYSGELKSKNKLITRQKAEIEMMNTRLEKRMLRAQMNPHFIFNALSAIQHFITANDKGASLHYLSLFSAMLKIGRAPSELQSLMRISYAVFCLKKKNSYNYS